MRAAGEHGHELEVQPLRDPRVEDLRAINFNVQSVVVEAMHEFLPSAEYKLEYNVAPSAGRGIRPGYLISVTITGELSSEEMEADARERSIEERSALDEAAGMDW